MSAKSFSSIISDVKVAIDEIAPNDAEFESLQDNSEMDTIIQSKITDAYKFIFANADAALVKPNKIYKDTDNNVTYADNNNVIVTLDSNFVRFCYAKLSSWSVYVSKVILGTDSEFATLGNKYATGTWERPKAALVDDIMTVGGGAVKKVILYKAKYIADKRDTSGTLIEEKDKALIGVVNFPSESNNSIDIQDELYRAVIYYIAGLTLLTYNESSANNFFAQALSLAGIQQAQ